MDYIRPANSRGQANFGWLDSRHTFSFGDYYDPLHMGISVLRVINDDRVIPGAGFPTHGHRDMEIITYVLQGAIEHKDSMGNRFIVPAGEIQRMSAGTGVTHSEYNASQTEPLHLLQIWIQPNVRGIQPSYEQARIEQQGPLTALVTTDGRDGSLKLHQDASIYRLQLQAGEEIQLDTRQRTGYLHAISGLAKNDSINLRAGDGLGLTHSKSFNLRAGDDGFAALWFDLPAVV